MVVCAHATVALLERAGAGRLMPPPRKVLRSHDAFATDCRSLHAVTPVHFAGLSEYHSDLHNASVLCAIGSARTYVRKLSMQYACRRRAHLDCRETAGLRRGRSRPAVPDRRRMRALSPTMPLRLAPERGTGY